MTAISFQRLGGGLLEQGYGRAGGTSKLRGDAYSRGRDNLPGAVQLEGRM